MKHLDCHIMMQVSLPIAIYRMLPEHVGYAITKQSSFFNTIFNKVFDPLKVSAL